MPGPHDSGPPPAVRVDAPVECGTPSRRARDLDNARLERLRKFEDALKSPGFEVKIKRVDHLPTEQEYRAACETEMKDRSSTKE